MTISAGQKPFFIFLITALFCAGLLSVAPVYAETAESEDPVYLSRLETEADWLSIAARPKTSMAARTETIKFIFTRDSWKLYLTNTKKWDIHYRFVRANIDPEYPHKLFNSREYESPDRRYIMGSISHYLDGDFWAMEIAPSDNMSAAFIEKAYHSLVKRTYFGKKMRFHPQSPTHLQRVEELGGAIPVWTMDDFQSAIQYQPLTLATGYGYLRFLRGRIDPASIRPDQILVTEFVPDDLPVCAGLITSQLQAPLAHISLLMEGRRTANMALRGAIDNQALRALEGKLVKLTVDGQDYSITPATRDEANSWWAQNRPPVTVTPQLISADIGLPDLCDTGFSDIGAIGGKAVYLGELCQLRDKGITIPGGFVIPVYHYISHMQATGIDTLINGLIKSEGLRYARPTEVQLYNIQSAIKTMPVSQKLLRDIQTRMRAFGAKKVILRSSANAEDIQGFTGAGLYRSKVISADADEKQIAAALRAVWGSLWNIRAYRERVWYRIDNDATAMAVIVQPFVSDVIANGVAVTANPFHHRRPGHFINAQTMAGNITGATGTATPESLIVYTFTDELETVLFSRSSLNGGKPILSDKNLETLTGHLEDIHKFFIPTRKGSDDPRAMDVEFLLHKDGHFTFLQARPYTVDFRSKEEEE
tara:strand:- start:2108 stop:4054 length:1947 start_codon:yes stop_codon:yes gene_type:complete